MAHRVVIFLEVYIINLSLFQRRCTNEGYYENNQKKELLFLLLSRDDNILSMYGHRRWETFSKESPFFLIPSAQDPKNNSTAFEEKPCFITGLGTGAIQRPAAE